MFFVIFKIFGYLRRCSQRSIVWRKVFERVDSRRSWFDDNNNDNQTHQAEDEENHDAWAKRSPSISSYGLGYKINLSTHYTTFHLVSPNINIQSGSWLTSWDFLIPPSERKMEEVGWTRIGASAASWASTSRFFLDAELLLFRVGEQLEPSPLTLIMTSLSVTCAWG